MCPIHGYSCNGICMPNVGGWGTNQQMGAQQFNDYINQMYGAQQRGDVILPPVQKPKKSKKLLLLKR